ncbi:MAG: hypothetical protein R3B09_01550 [Nannocystaceae bacterium]
MRTHPSIVTAALLGALALSPTPTAGAAVPVPRPTSPVKPGNPVKPVALAKLANPTGTAKAVSALGRFASGKLGATAYDRRIKTALGKVNHAEATAKRLIAGIEAIPTGDRAKIFVGVAKPESLTTQTFRVDNYRKSLSSALAKLLTPGTTTLAPDPFDPQDKGQFELLYRGARCNKTADADGSDETVVYLNVLSTASGSYAQTIKYLPGSGTSKASAGALDTSQAGLAWSSPAWPSGWSSAVVIVTAVLEDEGDLVERKQELDLLVQFALSETEEDTVTPDRMEVLRRELEDALALLHLANPARWSTKAVQVRKMTSQEYDELYLKPSTAAPVPHKLTMDHDPRGSSYTLYFDIPPPKTSYKRVYVKIKEIEALGADRDAAENKIADLGAIVAINGHTSAEAARSFGRDKNLVKPSWQVERDVLAGGAASITIVVFDEDPAPSCACTSQGGWPSTTCYAFCADADREGECAAAFGFWSSANHYAGACPKQQIAYDVNPLPDTGDGWTAVSYRRLGFTLDLTTKKLAGDVNGAPGVYTVYGTNGDGKRAKIVFEVGIK